MDRLERGLRVLLTAIALVAPPSAAWAAGHATYDHYARARAEQVARLHPVTAHLLTDARTGDQRAGAQSGFQALVEWSDRQGTRTGVAPVRPWLHRGASATVWLDARGAVAQPPTAPDLAGTAGVAVGVGAALGGAAVACGVWRVVGKSLDRRRTAQWGREWRRVEPGWSARYRG